MKATRSLVLLLTIALFSTYCSQKQSPTEGKKILIFMYCWLQISGQLKMNSKRYTRVPLSGIISRWPGTNITREEGNGSRPWDIK